MRFFIVSITIFFVFAAVLSPSAQAQRHAGYCDHTKSTAETLDCVNRHNNDTQARLSRVYKKLLAAQDDTAKALLDTAQNSWLAQRDAQCAWEKSKAPAPGLERIYELSCLSAQTQSRVTLLRDLLPAGDEDSTPPEFSASPRWMNVLSYDYPDIFWRTGTTLQGDTDCDGEIEHIITGIALKETKNDAENSGQKKFTSALVIAIAKNPVTGRPKVSLTRIPLTDDLQTSPRFCAATPSLSMLAESSSENGNSTENGACLAAIEARAPGCVSLKLHWDGKAYQAALLTDEPPGQAVPLPPAPPSRP